MKKWGFGLILLVVLAVYGVSVDGELIWNSLRALAGVEASDIVVILSLNILVILALNLRGYFILRWLGSPLSFGRWLQIRQLGFLVSFTTPGPQIGGEAAQIVALQKCGVDVSRATVVTGCDRVLDTLVNVCVIGALVGAMLCFDVVGLAAARKQGAMVSGFGALVLLGSLGLLFCVKKGLFSRWVFGQRLKQEIEALQGMRPGAWSALVLVGVLAWLFIGAEWWMLWRTIATESTWHLVIGTLVASRVALWAPMPGALGVFEAAVLGAALSLNANVFEAAAVCALSRSRDAVVLVISGALACREWAAWRRHT